MKKSKYPKEYLNDSDLQKEVLKGIRTHTRKELFKMASLATELSKSSDLPLKWRKKGSDDFVKFVISNRNVKLSVIYKKLEK